MCAAGRQRARGSVDALENWGVRSVPCLYCPVAVQLSFVSSLLRQRRGLRNAHRRLKPTVPWVLAEVVSSASRCAFSRQRARCRSLSHFSWS